MLPSARPISHACRHSRLLPSQYLFAIGHRSYLALGAYNHPFTLHSQTALLPRCATASGLSPSADAPSRACAPVRYNSLAALPSGLLQLRSPLLPESPLFSSPPLIDMLKSGGLPQAALHSRTARERCARPVSHAAALFVVADAN
jgi:hypothetical protein